MAVMDLEFYGLVRPVQERFIASTRALAVPTPMALSVAPMRGAQPWLAASILALGALIALTSLGFGNLTSPLALASNVHLLLYAVLLVLAVGCLLRALALRHQFLSLPFVPGDYLFPVGVIQARSARLRLHPLLDLQSAQITGRSLRVVFASGASFQFEARDEAEASTVHKSLLEAQKTLQLAEETGNRRELARLDPLRDNGFSNPFAPTAGYRRRTPTWASGWIPLSLIIGVVGGYGLWKARNFLGESRLYAVATAQNSVEAYRAYLARGGDRATVKDVLLPRAELKKAAAEGSVEAIEQYIAAHPGSKIGDEIASALRAALLTALEQAKHQGTLTAIRALPKRYKDISPIRSEIAEAEHALYEKAFQNYSAHAASNEKSNPVPFFRRLFDYVEHNGPKVEIRWRRQLRDSVHQADNQVKLSAYFMGAQSIPSQYFDAKHARAREAALSDKLLATLQPQFPEDMLRFELGSNFDEPDEKPDDSDPPLPNPTIPTLFITHAVDMTGGYMNANPRGIFVGAGLFFNAVFVIPNDQEPWTVHFSVWRPPDLTLLKQDGMTTEGMYDAMVTPAFDSFEQRYINAVFRPQQ
ncbi:MAG TPA: hypothetical protein VL137_02640 [Polyangiaceae bacterium]|nr:hypothetical protein [Polyangiaceae bacterium]